MNGKKGVMVQKELSTKNGAILCGDAMQYLRKLPSDSVDLIFTSPPFDLVKEKSYGNFKGDAYQAWISEFGVEFYRVLKPSGSLVMDLGSGWTPKHPTKNLYEYRLLLNFCDNLGFHLAQDFFWWNPSKLPTPAQWVTIERIRVKEAVNKIWWFSKTTRPKADNKKVLQRYSKSMKTLIESGVYNGGDRPSGHNISTKFATNNGGAIPPNLIAIANTSSSDYYSKRCKEENIKVHPARMPHLLAEFFIRFLSDEGDIVLDPFAGSCVTGKVAEDLSRRWTCVELNQEFVDGAKFRFEREATRNIGQQEYKILAPNFQLFVD